MTMLRVRDISVRFGGIVALDRVSLDLNRGEILGLIGPNGAGKTTLFNCISGVIRPDEGSLFFDGRSLKFAPPHERARRGIARTFQNLQLWGSMTVPENLTVPMDALGRRNTLSDALHLPFSAYAERASSERARAILHVLDLGRYATALAGDLPAGIQRRVEIARALATRSHSPAPSRAADTCSGSPSLPRALTPRRPLAWPSSCIPSGSDSTSLCCWS